MSKQIEETTDDSLDSILTGAFLIVKTLVQEYTNLA